MLILDSKGWMVMVPCLFAKEEKKKQFTCEISDLTHIHECLKNQNLS